MEFRAGHPQERPQPRLEGGLELDEPARKVIDHRGGSLLVLGGPGTGKTTLLERRYLALARQESLAPHRILYLCNNRTYSAEARDRLFWELPHEASIEVPVYTWHAFAYHLVTRYYARLGYAQQPVLLTSPEQWGLVKEMLKKEHRPGWGPWAERVCEDAFVDEVADFCLRVQQRMMTAGDLAGVANARPDWLPVIEFAGRYRAKLLVASKLDYPGLLTEALRLLSADPDVRSSLTRRFPHVLVDDAQEMSPVHVKLLEQLREATLCVAADPDSGIEKFRGAEPDWVFGFQGVFPRTEQITLARSHRIGAPLGPALNGLAVQNAPEDEHRPSSWAASPTQYECRVFRSLSEEGEAIAREFRRLHVCEGVPFDRMAVLVSQPGRLVSTMGRALQASQVPFHAAFGDRPLAVAPAVRSFLDLATVAVRAAGWQDRLAELLSSELIGLDVPTRRRLEREAWRTGRTLEEQVETAPECEELRRLRDLAAQHAASADECFWQVWCASSHFRKLEDAARAVHAGSKAAPGTLAAEQIAESMEALAAFSHSLARFVERRGGAASMSEYLSEAGRADFGSDPWLSPPTVRGPAVTICSFHSAKGRQWDYVAVAGCLDSWIPKGTRAQGLFDPFALEIRDIVDRQVEALADDRRTFYVAASRARCKVIFTASSSPGGRARPSRFLGELVGQLPDPSEPPELPPLSVHEFAARLRRTLASTHTSPAERVAALTVLAEVPGLDPARWYGTRDWTPGSTPLVADELRTSYSRLSPFENCGLQYVLQSVLGLDHESTYSMKFGTWLHALFEAVHKGEIRDIPTLRKEYARLFDEKIFPNRTIARQFEKDGEKMLKVFWENEVDRHTVSSEHPFTDLQIAGATVRGRIDRVDLHGKALKLTDYKTARWAPGYKQAERSLQLAIYHLAARQDPELRQLGYPEIARLVYPGAVSKRGGHYVLNQTAEQADKVLEKLPEMIGKILDEDFRPNPEADCYFCRMKVLCPLWPAGSEVSS